MADHDTASSKLISPVGRASFPHLFTPRASDEGGDPKYALTLIFDEEAQKTPEFAAIKEAVKRCIAETYKGKPPANLKIPFRRGEEKEHLDGYEPGTVFITATSKRRPQVVGPNMAALQEDDFYPGCFARASLRVFPYERKGNKGISFGLGNVQLVRDGERLGGGSRAEDDFQPVASSAGSDLDDLLS